MFIIALVIAVPVLALVLAALVRDVRDDGYSHRAHRRGLVAAGHAPLSDSGFGTPFSTPSLR